MNMEKAVAWCREHNLEFDAVNDNLPEVIALYGNNSKKISCDYYIDDRWCGRIRYKYRFLSHTPKILDHNIFST